MVEVDRYTIRNQQAVETNRDKQDREFDIFFGELLHMFPQEEHESLTWAYTTAREAHGNKKRKSGQLYFGHVISVTRIAIEEYDIKDPALAKALLLHDVGEDATLLDLDITKMPYDDVEKDGEITYGWRSRILQTLPDNIGQEATELFIALTRPQINGIDIHTKEQATEKYFHYLETSRLFVLAKSPDVLDNVRTLRYFDIEKQNEKIELVQNFYIPLFQRTLPEDVSTYIVGQLEHAFDNLRAEQMNKKISN
jgi:(p)ppGpp synthase/HD superfamily hydrolase